MIGFATALMLAASLQTSSSERLRAEQLAREGRTGEALQMFERVVAADPGDTDARLWIARLDLRLGRIERAETAFRAVLADHPDDVDARIGLGMVLTRKGAWRDAIVVLREAEPRAGENADLYAALARAHRRAGDDGRALDYFTRAVALSPADPELRAGYENLAHAYADGVRFEGYGQDPRPGDDAGYAAWVVRVRTAPHIHVEGLFRTRTQTGASDAAAGAGFEWSAPHTTVVAARASGGPGNVALPIREFSGEVTHYRGPFELGGGVRRITYANVAVSAFSPEVAWDVGGRWRFATRYTYSRSTFDATGQTEGDHSTLLRTTWRGTRRVWLTGAYSYGIESFETLTADRVAGIGAHTIAGGVHVGLRSLTVINATVEYQRLSNDSRLTRLTLGITQVFP